MLDKTFGVKTAEHRGLSARELASFLEGRSHDHTVFFRVAPFQSDNTDYCSHDLQQQTQRDAGVPFTFEGRERKGKN